MKVISTGKLPGNPMKQFLPLLAFIIMSQTGFAKEIRDPGKITCHIKVIENINTVQEHVIHEQIVNPVFTEIDYSGSQTLNIYKTKKFEINITLSYLEYAPLLSIAVDSYGVHAENGMRAVVTEENPNITTIGECREEVSEVTLKI